MPKTDKYRALYGLKYLICPVSDDAFEITETVAVGTTFYSWLFHYGGKIRIVAPEELKADFLS